MTTPDAERIRQAVDILFSYNKPVIEQCLAELGIRVDMPLEDLRDYVIKVLTGQVPRHPVELSSLVAGLDRLQECGAQHVFLYRMMTDRREEYLAQLREEAFIRRRMEGCGAAECFNGNRFIWDAETPELASVRHNRDDLLLKWVETRTWMKKTETIVDPITGKKVDVSIPQYERSCNFFHLDLRTGSSELLIQTLHENPNQSLRWEAEIYRQLVTQTLGLDPCLPIALEPVIRMLLIDRAPDIRRWIVVLARGGWLDGHDARGPDAEQLKSGEFAGLELHYDWHPPDAANNKIRVRLFARTDHFDVHSPCRPKDHRALLAEIRGYGEDLESILDPDLRAVAERDPSLHLVMHKLDLHISRLGKTKVDARQLLNEEGIPKEVAFAAFEALRKQNGQRFRLAYYVQDPQKGKPIKRPDGTIDYETQSEIPREVQFKRAKILVTMATEGKIGARISMETPPPKPWVISLHGIRTSAKWQKPLTEALNNVGIPHKPFDYGYFRLIPFFMPWARRKKVDWFRDAYTDFCRNKGVERCSIIAHSFGTYLVAAAIEIYDLKFDKIILCGSIVKRDFPWARFLDKGCVRKVFNDCGRDDLWVKLVVRCVKDSGASGVFEFKDNHHRLLQRVHSKWRHSDFFYMDNFEKRWIPFLKGRMPE